MHETDKIIRAWKDDDYRMSLSADELRALPENPAGVVEVSRMDSKEPYTIFGTVVVFGINGCAPSCSNR